MSSDLIQRLQRLQRGFSALCVSEADAEALLAEAGAFRRARLDRSEHTVPAEASSELAELLQRFAGLHQALHGASKLSGARAMQVIAACLAIGGCAELSARLPLQRGMMFRLTSALALVFGVGPAVMRHCASPASGASVELQHFLVECNDQLSAVIGVLMRAAREPEAMEAFVRTAGRPQAVLPWLLAISQALLAVPTDVRGDAPILQGGKRISRKDACARQFTNYVGVAYVLLFEQAHAYYDAMKQAPATQQAVLSVLLDRCLPLLAADCSPETLADARHIHTQLASNLGCAVCSPCLQRELQQRMDQPQAANYIRHALRVVTALPLRRSSAALPGMYGEQHKGSAVLLARLCSPGQRAMLPDSDCVALAWSFVEALPRIAAVVAALAADDGVLAEQLAQICMALQRAAAALLYQGLTAISSGSQLAAWAAACDATLRLAPSLLQLQERCQQLERESWQQAPLLLFHQLLDVAPLAASACDHIDAQGMQSGAAHAQVTRQLWALHTNACRMLAWLAADCSGVRTAALASRPDHGVVMLLELLSDVRYVLLNMAERSVEQGELSEVCVHGMCAAHWQAIQTGLQLLGGLSGCGDALPHIVLDLQHIGNSCGALLVDASFANLFSEALARLAPRLWQFPDAQQAAAESVGTQPGLVIALARSNTLQLLLVEARQLVRNGDVDAATWLALVASNALFALDHAALKVIDVPVEPTPQRQALLRQLRNAAGVSAGLECGPAADDAALLVQLPELSSRLPAATKLADLLHQWWQPAMQQELHAEAQLALAQGAATRSCAYLCCANLGGEGGPAAGQGVGSMRCSACRAVWYCGTACSHADWREGGHRRVCKALGAARRAAKEAATVAAAAAGEGQQGS